MREPLNSRIPPHFSASVQHSIGGLRVCCLLWATICVAGLRRTCPFWGSKYHHLLLVFRTQSLKLLRLFIQSTSHCYSVGWVTTTPEEDALCPYKVFFEIMPKTPTNWLARDLWNLVFIQWFLNHYYSGIQISLTLSSGVSSGCCLLSLDITQQF